MKTLLIVAIFVACNEKVYSQSTCQNGCQDILGTPMCIIMKQNCGSLTMGIFCQSTCKTCTSCPAQRSLKGSADASCELGVCANARNSLWCAAVKQGMKDGCVIFGNQCKATCGLCKICKLPPTELACTEDCEDSDNKTCSDWKKKGYCDVKKGFPDTRVACPLSCGTCKLCPTVPPAATTIKPTTTKSTITSQDCTKCKDTNQFCAYWKKEGYCDVSKGFPDTRKACPRTCEVCNHC